MLRALALFPLVFAAAYTAVVWLVDGEALASFLIGQRFLVRVLAIAGAIVAASAFSRGEHLRRAWQWLAISTILVLCRDLLRFIPVFAAWTDSSTLGAILVRLLGVVSNVFLLVGVWQLARSWWVGTMTLPGGRGGLAAVTAVAAALALAVAGPSVVANARLVAGGDSAAVVIFVSSVVDILALCLLSPLFLASLSLRGGLFAWPWMLITASLFSWLLYDGAELWKGTLAPGGFPLPDLFRGMAQNFQFAAGVAQALVVKRSARRLRKPPAG